MDTIKKQETQQDQALRISLHARTSNPVNRVGRHVEAGTSDSPDSFTLSTASQTFRRMSQVTAG